MLSIVSENRAKRKLLHKSLSPSKLTLKLKLTLTLKESSYAINSEWVLEREKRPKRKERYLTIALFFLGPKPPLKLKNLNLKNCLLQLIEWYLKLPYHSLIYLHFLLKNLQILLIGVKSLFLYQGNYIFRRIREPCLRRPVLNTCNSFLIGFDIGHIIL